MKIHSFLSCTILSVVLTTTTFANTHPAIDANTVLNEYAESHLNTDANKLEKILSSDALMKFSKGTEVLSQGQASIIKVMRQNQGTKQNCATLIEVLASNEAMMLARVNFVYDGFVIENYLTLEVEKNQSWKITRINKFYKDNSPKKVLTRE